MEKAGDALRSDIYRILCQFYDSFFSSSPPLDIRKEPSFWLLVQVCSTPPSSFFYIMMLLTCLFWVFYIFFNHQNINFLAYEAIFFSNHFLIFFFFQKGLVHADSLIRKRSSYLLKKAIQTSVDSSETVEVAQFRWTQTTSAQLQKLWDTFFLIYETLDEFNVHCIFFLDIYLYRFVPSMLLCFILFFDVVKVVKPVWSQLAVLFANSALIDFSWIEVLLRKGLLLHPNVTVIKLLSLDFVQVHSIFFLLSSLSWAALLFLRSHPYANIAFGLFSISSFILIHHKKTNTKIQTLILDDRMQWQNHTPSPPPSWLDPSSPPSTTPVSTTLTPS